jgi:hypothetical protein
MKKKKTDIEIAACMAFESLKNQLKQETKEALRAWFYWRFFPPLIVLVLVVLVAIVNIFDVRSRIVRWVEEDLTRKVESTYDDKNISIFVDGLIEEKASDVIRMQASQRINSIIEAEIRPIIVMHDLALKAGQGYRTAYLKLDSIARISDHEYAELSRDIVSEIHGIIVNYFPLHTYRRDVVSDKGIIERLRDEHINVRQIAVCSVGEREMYDQIPYLIDMLETEQNLFVLAAITYVLNQFLDSRMSIFESDFQNKYEQLWRKKRYELVNKRQ